MNSNEARPLADIAFAIAVVLFAGIVYWGTLDLPPPRYEPMGSGALPRALAIIMSLLAIAVGARGVVRLRAGHEPTGEPLPFRRKPALAVATVALLIGYLLVMEFRLAGFVPTSIVAFSLLGSMLVGFEWRRLPAVIGFVTALVLVSYLVFTKLFYIDLP